MKRTWGAREAKIIAAKQQWRCAHCDELLPSTFELDHIVPLHLGGSNDFETNSAVLCNFCHATKTQKEMIELTKMRRLAKQAAVEERLKAIEEARSEQPLQELSHPQETKPKKRKPPPPPAPGDKDFVDDLTIENPFIRFAYTGPVGRAGYGWFSR